MAIYGAGVSDAPPKTRGRLLFTDLRFYGKVTAGKKKCASLRKLELCEKRDGPDFKLGTGFSDTLGYWSINSSSENLDTATVYAKAPKAKRGNVLCKPDRSPLLTLT